MNDRITIPTAIKVGDTIQFENMYGGYTLINGDCQSCCFHSDYGCSLNDCDTQIGYLRNFCSWTTCFIENEQKLTEIPTEFEIGSLVSFKNDNRIFRVEKRTERGCEDCCFNVNDSCMSENHNVEVGYLAVLCNKNNCIYKELKEE